MDKIETFIEWCWLLIGFILTIFVIIAEIIGFYLGVEWLMKIL